MINNRNILYVLDNLNILAFSLAHARNKSNLPIILSEGKMKDMALKKTISPFKYKLSQSTVAPFYLIRAQRIIYLS